MLITKIANKKTPRFLPGLYEPLSRRCKCSHSGIDYAAIFDSVPFIGLSCRGVTLLLVTLTCPSKPVVPIYFWWTVPVLYPSFIGEYHQFRSGSWTRTSDPQVMSLMSYLCSIPQYKFGRLTWQQHHRPATTPVAAMWKRRESNPRPNNWHYKQTIKEHNYSNIHNISTQQTIE